MKENSFLTQLWQSVSSVRFYQEMGHRSFQEGVRYFSILILWVTLFLSIRFSIEIFKQLSAFEAWSARHLPDIVIQKGEVSADVTQPWRKEIENFLVVIDTTGQVKEIEESFSQGILLMKNKLILKRSAYETRRYDLSKMDAFRLSPETVKRWRQVGQWILPPVLVFFLFFYFWVGKSLQILFFSLVSLVTNWASRRGLAYQTLLVIGIYALTAPLLLLSAVTLLGLQIRFFDLIYLSMYAALLVATILQCPRVKSEGGSDL